MTAARIYCIVCSEFVGHSASDEKIPPLLLCKKCQMSLEALCKKNSASPDITEIILWTAKRAKTGERLRISRLWRSKTNKKFNQETKEEVGNEGKTPS